ncbi:MAG: ferrochelatase, partial [Planctomycetaceae bacterium]
MTTSRYDAILIVAFGGPEKRDDVLPFLENVLRGRNVPRERMLAVAEHYDEFDGKSPLNDQVRAWIAALRTELDAHGITLPIYWGNRNWHPLLADTLRQMAADGVQRGLALVLAAYSSYSSCRQYRENLEDARRAAGDAAPAIDKVRVFYNHPLFVAANADRLREALQQVPPQRRGAVQVAFTAHSIPQSMADGCHYELQLTETCRLVSESLGIGEDRWRLVYQSRSGRPSDPWLGPDICDHLAELHERGIGDVAVMPIGFLSDHVEILYDLDEQARSVCAERGMTMIRAGTVGTHPTFVALLRELIAERLRDDLPPRALGRFGASHDVCPVVC